ncbi:MAG: hypothetical protein QF819_01295 [Gemmatimonadota bacterium]|jgi:hypothetical protein|nr:hypothetical protein [Gemmatimonadota bacterium]MDP6801803.1 hypothetical protein [Gemmatimonadota bacterium]MDP7032558.1 hypothetical protein [Gemmatimonadota bacterium]
MKISPRILLLSACLFSISLWGLPALAEHPEHPGEHPEHPGEHPEHPGSPREVSLEELGDSIEAYVAAQSALLGGFFLVWDTQAKEALALELVKVHRERLASLGDDVYFACADFRATNGKIYDLDIFMKDNGEALETTQVTVHKEEGVARYGWVEKGGVWSMVSPK